MIEKAIVQTNFLPSQAVRKAFLTPQSFLRLQRPLYRVNSKLRTPGKVCVSENHIWSQLESLETRLSF